MKTNAKSKDGKKFYEPIPEQDRQIIDNVVQYKRFDEMMCSEEFYQFK